VIIGLLVGVYITFLGCNIKRSVLAVDRRSRTSFCRKLLAENRHLPISLLM